MSKTKNLINILNKNEKNVFVGVRLDRNLLAKIDELSDNRSEFIRQAIEFYIRFLKVSNDLLDLLKKLEVV
jgi:Arc/MetJ-type ribon-helix-helix transcriptional regulator